MAKILVIDDEEQLRDLLKQMLGRDGHEVQTACDGVEGMKIFGQFSPDLVITDIIMPNKDGIEVITELLCGNTGTPIIAISGGRRAISSDFNLQSAELLGVTATLKKPFTASEMRRTIKKILG